MGARDGREPAGPALREALEEALRHALGDGGARVRALRRLSGGASRETWSFDIERGDGRIEPLVLRRDPPGAPKAGMAREALLLRAAARAGVPVPATVLASDDPAVLGSSFVVMERVEGETIPRRILRDPAFDRARPALAAQCGSILATLHGMDPPVVEGLDEGDQLERHRVLLDQLGEPHPAFELAFRWLHANRPVRSRRVLVHGDFRNGNLIVGAEGIRAVLDWELAHIGDPAEDLGWLCVRSWRFGSPLPVGGFGDYAELLGAYEAAGGEHVEPGRLRWWEVYGNLRWGIICIVQTMAHTTGAVRSVELAAIGRRVCEVEWDLLDLIEDAP